MFLSFSEIVVHVMVRSKKNAISRNKKFLNLEILDFKIGVAKNGLDLSYDISPSLCRNGVNFF